MLTTKILSPTLGENASNPKPTTGVNWLGHPMKPGESYWGNSEDSQDAPQTPVKPSPTRRKRKVHGWTPEKRKAMSDRFKALWAAKRALPSVSDSTTDSTSTVQPATSPSVEVNVT